MWGDFVIHIEKKTKKSKYTSVYSVVERLTFCVLNFRSKAPHVNAKNPPSVFTPIDIHQYLYAGWLFCCRAAPRGG